MLTEPLPTTLDVRKAGVRGVTVSGTLKPLDLKRFRPILAADDGSIRAQLTFSRDEENRYLITVEVDAEVAVTCQRCLELMPDSVSSENTLAVVWTDEQAQHLPRHLDALIVGEEGCNLWELVEDELILALPSYSYHEAKDCNEVLKGYTGPAPDEVAEEGRPNPFDVLAQLKPGNEH
jgi:uncharacterized protein